MKDLVNKLKMFNPAVWWLAGGVALITAAGLIVLLVTHQASSMALTSITSGGVFLCAILIGYLTSRPRKAPHDCRVNLQAWRDRNPAAAWRRDVDTEDGRSRTVLALWTCECRKTYKDLTVTSMDPRADRPAISIGLPDGGREWWQFVADDWCPPTT